MKKYLYEIHKRKDLLLYLVSSGLKAQHRNSFLGYLWWMLDPLLNVLIYYFVVAIIFQSGGEGFGPYLVVGMIVWRWTSTTVIASSRVIVSSASIISQVYLPKAIFSFGASLTQLINFGFGLLVIAVFLVFFKIIPGVEITWLPVITVIQLLFLMAVALALSFISVFIRDMENLVGHLMRLWFYGSPVIWRDRLFPEKVRWLVEANPMTHFLAGYRNILLYKAEPDFVPLLIIGILSVMAILVLLFLYKQHEHRMIKIL